MIWALALRPGGLRAGRDRLALARPHDAHPVGHPRLEWLIQNAAVDPDRWWALNPANIGTVALSAWLMTRLLPLNPLTRTLLGIYAATMLLDVTVAFSGATTERWYFDAVNGTFALRLLIVGGWGVWCWLRHRSALGAHRPLPLPASRATLARHRPF